MFPLCKYWEGLNSDGLSETGFDKHCWAVWVWIRRSDVGRQRGDDKVGNTCKYVKT